MRRFSVALTLILLTGCASQTVNVTSPSNSDIDNTKTVSGGFDETWESLVEGLSRSFFVINNIEKESGIINVSFSTQSPEDYLDCGQATITAGEQTKTVNPAASNTIPWIYNQGIYTFVGTARRETNLEGRVNVFVKEASPDRTEVSANARYIVNINATNYTKQNQAIRSDSHKITFNTGGSGTLQRVECRSNGKLERRILSLANRQSS